MPSALERALTDPPLRPLPDTAADLLRTLSAPPRLAAHLRLVHDVAWRLTAELAERCPALAYDRDAVLFGAATHDIGKTLHPGELAGPGHEHEQAGARLLRAHGIDPELARFAAGHAQWDRGSGTEDLLVTVADKVWKGKRVAELEQLLADRVTAAGTDHWEAFLLVDTVLERLATGADERLAWQGSYPR
ncbi:HDIG domain-containing protein [Catellatospora sp. KI3]|uniref:HD domain-containing protein n=1 Tax=Catellatospora sp. KI3 TaxID=3041620 RepID=UPI00248311A1|nr:HD domain-containing protein [Catellatospora sp. KI3]MDI1459555.1 HDIG domain-containing protein [Catellatospora sp. KI3]